jgi:hypothetical protein
MNPSLLSEFWKWLWSDWGKPNFLTRAGVPRVATNLLMYIAGTYIIYYLTLRFASPPEGHKYSQFIRSPLIIFSWAVFYVSLTLEWFVSWRYHLKGLRFADRNRVLSQNSKDVAILASWMSLGISILLFLAGAIYFNHRSN